MPMSEPVMTYQQAAARSQQLLREAADALTPPPEPEPWHPLSGDTSCQDPAGATSGLVTVAHTWLLRGIPADRAAVIGKQVSGCWAERGYATTHAQGVGTPAPEILARTADGFRLALQSNAAGLLALSATSPCVRA